MVDDRIKATANTPPSRKFATCAFPSAKSNVCLFLAPQPPTPISQFD